MLSNVLNALGRKRRDLSENDKGFTLIELLVVVIIIGILAAIAIPVYMGVQSSAKDNAVKSDLTNIKTAIVAYQTQNDGDLPAAVSDLGSVSIDDSNYGDSTAVEPDTITKTTDADGVDHFCVSGGWKTGHIFNITDKTSAADGDCS